MFITIYVNTTLHLDNGYIVDNRIGFVFGVKNFGLHVHVDRKGAVLPAIV